jgi:hypothetical protein
VKNLKIVLSLIILFSSSGVAAGTGSVFKKGTGRSKVLFTMQNAANPNGAYVSEYLDSDGKLSVSMSVRYGSGPSQLKKFEIKQMQTNEEGVIELNSGKIRFSKTVSGKQTVKEELIGQKRVVVPLTIPNAFGENYELLDAGKPVVFYLADWENQDLRAIEISKQGTEKINDEKILLLKVRPLGVDGNKRFAPMLFKFGKSASLIEYTGLAIPKIKEASGKWVSFEAEVEFSY